MVNRRLGFLKVIPLTLKEANNFVKLFHRHNLPAIGCKFAIGAIKNDILIGVAIAGRPINRFLDNKLTLEILRVCTNGTRNANSFLYSKVKVIGKAMGYEKIITYTLQKESGASLKAINAIPVAKIKPQEWNTNKRKRKTQKVYKENKIRWEL